MKTDINVEFQIEDILEQQGSTFKVYGRCCGGVISVGDNFRSIYQRKCLVAGVFYRESDSEKQRISIKIIGIEYMHKPVDEIQGGVSGLLEIDILSRDTSIIKPKRVLSGRL